MINEESWMKFEQTGGVREYLDYTACANEVKLDNNKEISNDPNGYCNRNCVSNNAHWGL